MDESPPDRYRRTSAPLGGKISPAGAPRRPFELPDVRDGLTRTERIVLWQLSELQRELGGRSVPTAMLYGRVVEFGVPLSPQGLSALLARLGAAGDRSA